MDIAKLNEDLEKGILPFELDLSNGFRPVIDWEKLKYNAFYRSYEFYADRYKNEIKGIPYFYKVVEKIVEQKEEEKNAPSREYEQRFSAPNNIDGIVSDTFLQQECQLDAERE